MPLLNIDPIAGSTLLSYSFCIKITIDILAAFTLIRYVYFRNHPKRENVFLFSIINLLIFIISYLLNSVNIGMGSAFGLFAVFSILKYRTEKISVRDITYIFLLIAIGLINAVSIIFWPILSLINVALLATTYALDSGSIIKNETSLTIIYPDIELIKPNNPAELIQDLESRLGVKISAVSIKEVNFSKRKALVEICYYNKASEKGISSVAQNPDNSKGFTLTLPSLTENLDINNGYKINGKAKEAKENKYTDTILHKKERNKEKTDDFKKTDIIGLSSKKKRVLYN